MNIWYNYNMDYSPIKRFISDKEPLKRLRDAGSRFKNLYEVHKGAKAAMGKPFATSHDVEKDVAKTVFEAARGGYLTKSKLMSLIRSKYGQSGRQLDQRQARELVEIVGSDSKDGHRVVQKESRALAAGPRKNPLASRNERRNFSIFGKKEEGAAIGHASFAGGLKNASSTIGHSAPAGLAGSQGRGAIGVGGGHEKAVASIGQIHNPIK